MAPRKKFEILASETCISSMLEQKLEFLDRRQISLNFSFFIQSQLRNTLLSPGSATALYHLST